MSATLNSAPIFQRHIAKAIVKRVKTQVDGMLKESKLDDSRWEEKGGSFQLFEKMDLQLGKLVGSGGFSDVYEIRGFNKAQPASWSWTFRKDAAHKYYKENAVDQNGQSRYVVKQLKSNRMDDANKFCTAAADLVMEAHFLSNLNHENILKIRGWAAAGVEAYLDGEHDSYFLILDRLEDTLDKRLERWKKNQVWKTASCHLSMNISQLSINDNASDLLSRVKVSHQIASALQYLHSKNIIFRDLKPNNVGFDKYGTVKIFDFGLCREMPEECTNVNDVYKMSGRIGTLRYMAPEVALLKSYNQKSDTYSWALLFWYCLSLSKPYPSTTRSQHLEQVCQYGERPAINNEWSKSIRYLLQKSWAHDAYNRFTMIEVCAYLERIQTELMSIEIDELKLVLNDHGRSFPSVVPLPTTLIRETSNPFVPMVA